jgi:UDP-N-acetylmuramate--alanine ligase
LAIGYYQSMAAPEIDAFSRKTSIHLVGAKGTGMTALAEILVSRGCMLSGSDVSDIFYTDSILASLGIPIALGFREENVPSTCELVIHSAAYSADRNPELLEARRRGIPILSYPEALGSLSRSYDSAGIAGVHGKTTTTALAGTIASALGLQATILAGSGVSSFGGRSTLILGDSYLIAETCEYRRHFLHFSPHRILVTSIEPDHQDCFPTYKDIFSAFTEYASSLPPGGALVYCADEAGAKELAEWVRPRRPDIGLIPYGEHADGPWKLESYVATEGRARFTVRGIATVFELRVPGRHVALDAVGALALCHEIARSDKALSGRLGSSSCTTALQQALASFAGSKRRSELVGEAKGVIFLDDYGHHPTAIEKTILGIREFWPSRRLVVDFMSHTYSRTKALLDDFAASLDLADELILHGIYASAREAPDLEVSGLILAEKARARAAIARHSGRVHYFESPLDAVEAVAALLHEGDLFLTIGAGDNWKIGVSLLDRLRLEGG